MEEDELLEQLGAKPGALIASKYRVEELLATGGMGAVVRARHEVLEQEVAIKLMRPEVAKRAELAQRFLREARAAARISSDYVARVTDVDRLADGTPFMVMEYLVGEDLHQVIAAEAPLPVQFAVDLVMEALAGVDAAHRLGIVHRDLKPSNLFVVRSEGRRRVKVLDFGISKALDDAASSSLKAGATTSTDAILGTPRYMSPEQVSSSKDVDGRTDLWSMGLILYEALAGEYPYVGDSAQALFAEILTVPVTSLRPSRTDVPEGLERALLRCLERARAQRWATARDLMLALAPFASNRVRHALLEPIELAAAQPFVDSSPQPLASGAAQAGTPPELVQTLAVRSPVAIEVDVPKGSSRPALEVAATTASARAQSGGAPTSAPRTHSEMEVETPVPASKSRLAAIGVASAAAVTALAVAFWSQAPSTTSRATTASAVPLASALSGATGQAASQPAPTEARPIVAPTPAPTATENAAASASSSASASAPAKPTAAPAASHAPRVGVPSRGPNGKPRSASDSSLLDSR